MGAPAHSEQVRAQAMAALLSGQSVSQVAREYKLPLGTVKTWRREYIPNPEHRVATEAQRERIGDLILDNLEALLTATRGIVENVSTDPAWVKRQTASELAVFVGVLYDKAIKIAAALPAPDGDGAAGDVLAAGAPEPEAAGG